MKLFLKLLGTAFFSTLVFGVFFGAYIAIEDYYAVSTFGNLAGGFIYGSLFGFPVYLTIGILFSYLIIWITKKVDPNKPYFFGLLIHSLLGLILGAIIVFVLAHGIFDFLDTIYFMLTGAFMFNIFYHIFLLLNSLKLKK